MKTRSSYGKRVRNILYISLFTALASQVGVHLFAGSFISSLGPLCIPMFVFLLDDVDIVPTALVSEVFIFGMRSLLHLLQGGDMSGVLADYLPEAIFYVTAGVLWYAFDRLMKHKHKLALYIPVMILIDSLGNEIELFLRMPQDTAAFSFHRLVFLVACVRGLILLVILVLLDQYRIMLLTKDHSQRYQRLIMLISKLSGEVVWMDKNFAQIEQTMATSYQLYEHLLAAGDSRAKDALSIAKDIHEIKKEYRLISRGISENITQEREDGMEMTELFAILNQAVQHEFASDKKKLSIELSQEDRLYTKDPYLFLSVFHNLIGNAMDAAETETCTVTIRETRGRGEDEGYFVYRVTDDGAGRAEAICGAGFCTALFYQD